MTNRLKSWEQKLFEKDHCAKRILREILKKIHFLMELKSFMQKNFTVERKISVPKMKYWAENDSKAPRKLPTIYFGFRSSNSIYIQRIFCN